MHLPVGKFEGKEIKCTREEGPLSPRELTIKEEVFDIIGTRIISGNVLDINDPNGLYGIEALSRGAGRVTFVGAETGCNNQIRGNLKKIGAEKTVQLFEVEIEKYFKKVKSEDKFQVIFFEVTRQEEVGAEAEMVKHLVDDGLLIMFVPIMGSFQVPVSVEGAVIQESRDCEQRVVLVVAKNR